jgi:hypothetical protein
MLVSACVFWCGAGQVGAVLKLILVATKKI